MDNRPYKDLTFQEKIDRDNDELRQQEREHGFWMRVANHWTHIDSMVLSLLLWLVIISVVRWMI